MPRGQDRAGPVSLACAEGQVEVALLRLRRQSGRGTAALHEDRDEGGLRHPGLADRLDHEAESAAGGGGHRPHAREARAHRHVHRGELVLDLLHDDPVLGPVGRHPVQDRRGRGHRILREELDAGGEGPEAHRLVPGHEVLRLIRVGESERKGAAQVLDRVAAESGGRDVLLDDLRFLVAPDVLEGALHVAEVHGEERDGRAEGDRVAHQGVRRERLRFLAQRDPDQADVLADLRRVRFHGIDVVDDRAALEHVGLVDVHRLLIQAQDDVRIIAVRQQRVQAAADLGPHVPAADHALIRRIGPRVEAAPSADLGERFGGR